MEASPLTIVLLGILASAGSSGQAVETSLQDPSNLRKRVAQLERSVAELAEEVEELTETLESLRQKTKGSPSRLAPSPFTILADPTAGLDGYCPVRLVDQKRWVIGLRQWETTYRAQTYRFAGPEQKRAFLADPDRYAPALSEYDVVLWADSQQLVRGRREHGVYFEGHVYLFASEDTLDRFARTPHPYVAAVEKNRNRVPIVVMSPTAPPNESGARTARRRIGSRFRLQRR
ncbi:MAG: hypothetical protein HQ567_33135 [Candidatus Nealsonbacteria bacterium]|nr:hypothetical protein [Candidatus Nealsonbacteria bacterium]